MAIGANASTVDEGCTARETARVAAMIGRMDIANAVLENLPAVQAALRAKSAREAALSGVPGTASLKSAPIAEPELKVRTNAGVTASNGDAEAKEQQLREQQLREQQNAAQEALVRQATMAKVNDTLKFTDASTQSREKTPQQTMAEEASAKLAAKDATKTAVVAPAAQTPPVPATKSAAQTDNTPVERVAAQPERTPAPAATDATHSAAAPAVSDAAPNAASATTGSNAVAPITTSNAPVAATTAPPVTGAPPVAAAPREAAPAGPADSTNDGGGVAAQSADAPAPEANTGLPSQELQRTSSADDAMASDSGGVFAGGYQNTSLKSSDAKAPDASTSTTMQQPGQQLSRVDSATMSMPLTGQQLARSDGKSSIVNANSGNSGNSGNSANSASTLSTASTAERVRAAKAAFGFK